MRTKLYLFHSFLLLSITIYGQDIDASKEIRKSMWELPEVNFTITEIPEKWEDEDAVIIATLSERSYRKPPLSAFLLEENSIHRRIKILSNASLSDYGQFSFKKSTYYRGVTLETYVGFKVIKPDGNEIIVDENEAVEEDLEMGTTTKLTTMKLAIPNLEVGDILDYYIVEKFKFPTIQYHPFDPAIFVLRENYPLIYGKIKFAVLRRCYINLKTYNGAPEFEKANEGDNDIYQLEYKDQDKAEPIPWFYPYRSLPTVKFKVTYASQSAVYQAPNLLKKNSPGYLNTSVSHANIATYAKSYLNATYAFSNLNKYMKSNFKDEKDQSVLAKEAFYHQRHMLSVQFQENWTIRGNSYIGLRRSAMLKSLSNYFKKARIPYSFIVGVPKRIGNVDQLIVEEEVLLGIRANTTPPVFITSFTTHSIPNELDQNFDGSVVLVSSSVDNIDPLSFDKRKMPQSSDSMNKEFTESSMKLNLESHLTDVHITKTLSGLTRFADQQLLMDAYDFIEEEREKYNLKSITEGLNKKDLEETRRLGAEYLNSREKDLHEKLLEKVKGQLDIEIDSVHSFKIIETGRSEASPNFKYEYTTSTQDLIKRAGNNYFLNIGKLIEKQTEIEEEYKEGREFDIYMEYPRRFHHRIEISIPEDYSFQGIDKLQISVENETGGFSSEASEENNTLIVDAILYYKNSYEPQENWGKLLELVDVAEDFGEMRILVKKN